jgi:hypothetical protein
VVKKTNLTTEDTKDFAKGAKESPRRGLRLARAGVDACGPAFLYLIPSGS